MAELKCEQHGEELLVHGFFQCKKYRLLDENRQHIEKQMKGKDFSCKQGSEHLQHGTTDFTSVCGFSWRLDSHGRELVRCTEHTEGSVQLELGDPGAPRGWREVKCWIFPWIFGVFQ